MSGYSSYGYSAEEYQGLGYGLAGGGAAYMAEEQQPHGLGAGGSEFGMTPYAAEMQMESYNTGMQMGSYKTFAYELLFKRF
ncbi:hypothetical protein V502_02832 [Pseudogymnoascus sp. VKM F-4520 (FW-2644)]|nr:hypothetical protein V502_02832 [Pseudogymnoascus sp. VKM F-4520 (FW-2644)]